MFPARQLTTPPPTRESGPSAHIRLTLKHETAQIQLVLVSKTVRSLTVGRRGAALSLADTGHSLVIILVLPSEKLFIYDIIAIL